MPPPPTLESSLSFVIQHFLVDYLQNLYSYELLKKLTTKAIKLYVLFTVVRRLKKVEHIIYVLRKRILHLNVTRIK